MGWKCSSLLLLLSTDTTESLDTVYKTTLKPKARQPYYQERELGTVSYTDTKVFDRISVNGIQQHVQMILYMTKWDLSQERKADSTHENQRNRQHRWKK